eukprot:gene9487-biopygen15175
MGDQSARIKHTDLPRGEGGPQLAPKNSSGLAPVSVIARVFRMRARDVPGHLSGLIWIGTLQRSPWRQG